jgi:hypothetical protein
MRMIIFIYIFNFNLNILRRSDKTTDNQGENEKSDKKENNTRLPCKVRIQEICGDPQLKLNRTGR